MCWSTRTLGGAVAVMAVFGLWFASGCVVSEQADCVSDEDCEDGQLCTDGGGLFVRDGVCVDPDGAVDPDAGPSDVGPDAGPSDVDTGPSCEGGEIDCGGECVDVRTNRDHCGDCGHSCQTDHYCIDGQCVDECDEDAEDQMLCDDDCVDPTSDLDHCGACGNVCSDDVSGASADCVDGACTLECVDDSDVLCESASACVDTSSDPNHCGECAHSCDSIDGTSRACEEGVCVYDCDGDSVTYCVDGDTGDGICIDTADNAEHCGGCGNPCPDVDDGQPVCVSGQCEIDCDDGFAQCGGECVDTDTDDEHCGGCDQTCGSQEACEAGSCQPDWDCNVDGQPFGGGTGESNDPYRICAPEHVEAIDDELNAEFVITENVDMQGATMTPLGVNGPASSVAFSGSLDGQGFEIANLIVQPQPMIVESVGLFFQTDGAEISNLILNNVDVDSTARAGVLAGVNGGSIEEVSVTGQVEGQEGVGGLVGINEEGAEIAGAEVSGEVVGQQQVGGLVGENRGEITESSSSADVEGVERVGGLVGDNGQEGECRIAESEAYGEVMAIADDSQMVGGLAGRNHIGCLIEDSAASGDVSAAGVTAVGGLAGSSRPDARIIGSEASGQVEGGEFTGGLVGRVASVPGEDWSEDEPAVDGCHAVGDVSGTDSVGGLVGRLEGTAVDTHATGDVDGDDLVGGLVGHVRETDWGTSGSIDESYATGDVTGEHRVAGLVGYQEGAVDRSTRVDGLVVGHEEVGGLVGRSTAPVNESHSESDVEGEFRVGGLVGDSHDRIDQCFATGDIENSGNSAGGLVGRMAGEAQTVDSYATGAVVGDMFVGGLVGGITDGSSIGLPTDGVVSSSHSTGSVEADGPVWSQGGLVGESGGEVIDSYWNIDSSGATDSDGGTGLSASEYTEEDNFGGVDFEDVWQMGSDGPVLQWE